MHLLKIVIKFWAGNDFICTQVLAILAAMPELHVLNMSNNQIQQTTGPGAYNNQTNLPSWKKP